MTMSLNDFDFIDVHYHVNPDLYLRRHSAIAAGTSYQKHHAAVVLTSHLGATSVQATIAQAEGYPVLPSVVLNHIAGGIDYRVVVRALLEYTPLIEARMLVHLPTITGRAYKSHLKRTLNQESYQAISCKPLTVFNEQGRLKPEVIDLIKLAANEPVVLSTGHASKAEVYALIEETAKYPNCYLMLNQPANPLTGFDAHALSEIAANSHVFIEQTLLTYLLNYQSQDDFKEVLTNVPRVIYSSDLGQTTQMDIDAYVKHSRDYFRLFHISDERKEQLWKKNPAVMLAY